MLGLSKSTTRNELLRIKHSGMAKEFSDWVQRNVLDKGHAVEALDKWAARVARKQELRAFGDAGKAAALILLILQLSSAGGVMPVELSGSFYQSISPWLPFTWVIKALRASMFGAFDGQWLHFWLAIGLAGGLGNEPGLVQRVVTLRDLLEHVVDHHLVRDAQLELGVVREHDGPEREGMRADRSE